MRSQSEERAEEQQGTGWVQWWSGEHCVLSAHKLPVSVTFQAYELVDKYQGQKAQQNKKLVMDLILPEV